jgi:hypothetical protein
MQRLVALGAVAATCALTPVVVALSLDDQTGHTTTEAAIRCGPGCRS